MIQEFSEDDIEPLATGAWILGTGGGGNPYISTLNLRRLYAEGKRVKVMDPMALADDDMVAVGVANRQFHYLTFEQSELSRTKRIVNQLWNMADPYRPLYADLLDLAKVNCEHVLMTEAMAEGDVDRVIALNHQHRSHSIDHLRRVLGAEEQPSA